MPKTVRIRNIDDQVYDALTRHAADAGISVPELLRREATRLASRPSMDQWLSRVGRRPSTVPASAVLATLDGWRGDWP
jgi:antitoxin FitA